MREGRFEGGQRFRPISVRSMIEPFRRRWLILLVALAGPMTLVWTLTARLPPSYTATASVIIDRDRVPLGTIADMVSVSEMTDSVIVSNEIAVILSAPVLFSAVARVRGPQVPIGTRPIPLNAKELQNVRDSLKVTRNLNSLVIDVEAQAQTPGGAAIFANAIVTEYLASKVSARRAAADRTLGWIDGEVARLRDGIADLNQQVLEKQRAFLSDGGGTPLVVQNQLRAVGDAYATASIQYDNTVARLEELRAARDEGIMEASRLIDSPDLTALQRQIGDLRQQIAGAQTWRNDTPALTEGRVQLATLEERASELVEREISRLELDLRIMTDQTAKLSAERQRLQLETITLSETQAEIEQLGHEVAGNQQLYVELLTRRNEIAAQQEGISPEARMLSPAIDPTDPSGPRRLLYTLIAGFAGLIAAVGGILIWDALSARYRGLGHLAESTGLPLLAAARASARQRPVRDFELGMLPGLGSLMLQFDGYAKHKREPAADALIALIPATRSKGLNAIVEGLHAAQRDAMHPLHVVTIAAGKADAKTDDARRIAVDELLRGSAQGLRAEITAGTEGPTLLILPSPEEAEITVGWAALADYTVLVVSGRRPDKRACEQLIGRLRRAKATIAGVVAVV